MIKKLMTAVAAFTMVVGLAACGNTKSAEQSSHTSSHSSKVLNRKDNSHKKTSSDSVQSETSSSSSATTTTNSSSSKSSTTESSSSQMTMTAQDAKNIVKEHIGNQLNNAGIAGKAKPNVPSIDEIDGYTAVQNGNNDWTVSGNGHSYHVTTTSVTGK